MTALDEAWAVVKADTGMWDEIYAPLYEQLGGRGSGPMNYDSPYGLPALDFMPTDVAMQTLLSHLKSRGTAYNREVPGRNVDDDALNQIRGESSGDHGFSVERLKEGIMDEGFRVNPRHTPDVVPNFIFDDTGAMQQWEGRHRLTALHELGAPYIPSFGRGNMVGLPKRESIAAPWKLNQVYHDTDEYLPSQYSAASYYGPDKGRYPTPPSWIFDQEIVPDMGKLSPTVGGKPIPREDMINHIHDTKLDMDRWVVHPEWSVVHDD